MESRFIFTPSPKHVVALVDPKAGRGLGYQVIHLLERRTWGASVQVFTVDPAQPHSYRQAIDHANQVGANRLIVSGGDGTLMRSITAMLQTQHRLPISLIPTGTGNVVAGELRLPRRILPALRLAFSEANLHYWDLGRVTDTNHYFALRASAGHDANTLAYVTPEAKQWWGTMAYIGPGLRELLTMKPVTFTLTIDDQPPIQLQGATAFVTVISRISAHLRVVLSNQIRTDDGMLYAGVFHPQQILLNMPRILHHMALEAENFAQMVSLYPVRHHVRIEADPIQRTQIDGELLDHTPLNVDVVPNAIPFVTSPLYVRRTIRQRQLNMTADK